MAYDFNELRFPSGFIIEIIQKPIRQRYRNDCLRSSLFPSQINTRSYYGFNQEKADRIFYPSVVYEKPEFGEATNNFNCPVVAGYPEVIRVNVDALEEKIFQ